MRAGSDAGAVPTEAYLEAWRIGHWVYERRDAARDVPEEAIRYVRRSEPGRIREGSLVDKPFGPLADYLRPVETTWLPQPQEPRPTAPLGKVFGVFFELEEPMDPLPAELVSGEPVVTTTKLRYFDRQGRAVARGTLTRTAAIEGYEEVTCPAGRFERCLRARVDLEVRFPLILTIHWNTQVWVSAEAGEVRRVQKFSGRFLVFWFRSGQEFELSSLGPASGSRPAEVPTHWARGVVHLSGALPRPRIEGVIVDLAESRPAP